MPSDGSQKRGWRTAHLLRAPVQIANHGPLDCADSGVVRYYSLARYALMDALRLAGTGAGARVLLPSYVCRDLLAPLAMLGAVPVWYDVGPDLAPLEPAENWPIANAVLAIDYFGFAQDLTPFAAYVARTGAILIEDNAHGYLSQAEDGQWLGCRADLGLFSVRKTLRIPDGAALRIANGCWQGQLPAQIPFDGAGVNPAQAIKARMHRIPLIGESIFRAATGLARTLRKWRSGNATPQPDPDSECKLPAAPNPWAGLPAALVNCETEAEITRRRAAYAACAAEAERLGATPVFARLPEHCAPYAFAFRGQETAVTAMHHFADRLGFDLVTWPDLPDAFKNSAPSFYRNIFLINFLW